MHSSSIKTNQTNQSFGCFGIRRMLGFSTKRITVLQPNIDSFSTYLTRVCSKEWKSVIKHIQKKFSKLKFADDINNALKIDYRTVNDKLFADITYSPRNNFNLKNKFQRELESYGLRLPNQPFSIALPSEPTKMSALKCEITGSEWFKSIKKTTENLHKCIAFWGKGTFPTKIESGKVLINKPLNQTELKPRTMELIDYFKNFKNKVKKAARPDCWGFGRAKFFKNDVLKIDTHLDTSASAGISHDVNMVFGNDLQNLRAKMEIIIPDEALNKTNLSQEKSLQFISQMSEFSRQLNDLVCTSKKFKALNTDIDKIKISYFINAEGNIAANLDVALNGRNFNLANNVIFAEELRARIITNRQSIPVCKINKYLSDLDNELACLTKREKNHQNLINTR